MNEAKKDESLRKIREYILKSGFPQEIEIADILKKSGWLVGNQWPYTDKFEKKTRAVDVLALKIGVPPIGLLFECKKSMKHAWVFHTQRKDNDYLRLMGVIINFINQLQNPILKNKLSQLAQTATVGDFLGLQPSASKLSRDISGLHILDMGVRVGTLCIIPAEEDSTKFKDDFFQATHQVVSALESMAEGFRNFIVFPVIVFDGPMFEFETQEVNLTPTEHIQFITYKSGLSQPCLMDIVTRNYFPKYLEKVESDFSILSQIVQYKGENQ